MFYLYGEKFRNTVLAELQSMEGNTCTALVIWMYNRVIWAVFGSLWKHPSASIPSASMWS